MPNAQAAAINVFPERAGSASGITGFLQLVFAAGASQLVGVFTGDSAWPMLTCMLIAGVGALACLLLQPRPADPAPLGPDARARDDALTREDAGAVAPTDNTRARNG
jgi:MFS family permease